MMLSRAVARAAQTSRAARSSGFLPPSAIAWRSTGSPSIASAWARGMAKDNGPKPPRFASPSGSSSHPSPPRTASSHPRPETTPNSPSKASSQPSTPPHRPTVPAATESTQRATAESQATNQDASSRQLGGAAPSSPSDPDSEPHIPISSLPDLTQGIPSTLEYETTGATNRSSITTVDEAFAGGRGKGELPASAYISSSERRRARLANWLFGTIAGMAVAGTVYAGRNWDEEDERRHPDVPNGWGLGLWWNRAATRTREILTYYHEPAFEKLLPDPDPMYERPYTLCISLEDMLVHSEWTREHGWRLAKRPGVDYFLHYLSQYYEIVLFTTVPSAIAEPLVRKLDPFQFIVYPLFREATKYKDGQIVKDLSYLNRDLSKVIMLDTSQSHVSAQPENGIVLPKWTGDVTDKELVSLIPFLEYIFTMQYSDVRKVLKSFEGKHIPTEFARREAIARAEFQKQLESQKKQRPAKGGIAALGGLLGLKPSNMSLMVGADGEPNPGEEFAKGKMLQDIARERGQRAYEALEKTIKENGESWLKEQEVALEKAQQEAMESMKSSFTGWFVTPPPKKPAEAKSKTEEPKEAGEDDRKT